MVTLILWAVAWASDVPAALATGEDFSCKQIRDTVWCWGNNEDRQLGVERSLPMSVEPVQATLTGAVDLSASSVQACAVTQSGELVCWGQALKASWGQGVLPQRLGSVGDAAGVSLGPGRGCIRHRGGGVSCWETNRLAGRFEGVQQLFGAEQLAVGAKHACARVRGGEVWCWGDDRRGQLGQPRPGWPATAAPVPGLDDAIDLSSGTDATCAVRRTGRVVCWGPNSDGNLGLGHTDAAWGIQEVQGVTNAVQVSVGARDACARTVTGTVLCWGADPCPRPGAPTRRLTPIDIGITGATVLSEGGASEHHCVATPDAVQCWGFNSHGQAGDPSNRCIARP